MNIDNHRYTNSHNMAQAICLFRLSARLILTHTHTHSNPPENPRTPIKALNIRHCHWDQRNTKIVLSRMRQCHNTLGARAHHQYVHRNDTDVKCIIIVIPHTRNETHSARSSGTLANGGRATQILQQQLKNRLYPNGAPRAFRLAVQTLNRRTFRRPGLRGKNTIVIASIKYWCIGRCVRRRRRQRMHYSVLWAVFSLQCRLAH